MTKLVSSERLPKASRRGSLTLRIRLAFALGSLGLLLFPSQGPAEDCEAPCLGHEISTELQNDWIFAADLSFLEADVLRPAATADVFVAPTDYFKLMASIITEPVNDPVPGRSAAFAGIGTHLGEFYAIAELDPITLQAGKFDTVFSRASEVLQA